MCDDKRRHRTARVRDTWGRLTSHRWDRRAYPKQEALSRTFKLNQTKHSVLCVSVDGGKLVSPLGIYKVHPFFRCLKGSFCGGFLLLRWLSAHDNVIFPHTKRDTLTFHRSQSPTKQPAWVLFAPITPFTSLWRIYMHFLLAFYMRFMPPL